MNTLSSPMTESDRAAVLSLFDEKGPVLVEIRFPRMATAPDWFLCESAGDFDPIWDRLGAGVEVHLHSVWDLKNTAREVVLTR
jgi:hypothetical protein